MKDYQIIFFVIMVFVIIILYYFKYNSPNNQIKF